MASSPLPRDLSGTWPWRCRGFHSLVLAGWTSCGWSLFLVDSGSPSLLDIGSLRLDMAVSLRGHGLPAAMMIKSYPRMKFLAALLLMVGVVSLVWFWFEGRWDRRLFDAESRPGWVNLEADEARSWLAAHPQATVLDVRSPAEFNKGALPKATSMPLSSPDFAEQVARLPRDRPVLVYCAGGYRSRKALEVMSPMGFSEVVHLHRGYLSW